MIENVVCENERLIYSIIKYFHGYKDKEDLFQAGFIGLTKAYQKYDSSFGTKFSTYAYPYILGEIKKYVREDKGIKISREITKLNLKIEKAFILLSQKLMREPSITDLAHFLEIDEKYVAEAIISSNVLYSMDEVVGEDRDMTLHDVMPTIEALDMDTLLILKDALCTLEGGERRIIMARYMDNLTQQEIASELGMSQVQVSRKEQKVLQKLRTKIK